MRAMTHTLFYILLFGAVCSGCVTVAPYERATLARRDMAIDGNAEISSAEGHALEVREGAAGGFTSGGGCGCN
ncbi:MAG: DUF4266 domain-containing protein [Deltaproteobacteria bacterium]|nr:DUF4266 domain-containing protein [Deltaproteobacteria bacterium]